MPILSIKGSPLTSRTSHYYDIEGFKEGLQLVAYYVERCKRCEQHNCCSAIMQSSQTGIKYRVSMLGVPHNKLL